MNVSIPTGTKIKYEVNPDMKGEAIIVGIANESQPFIGRVYILKDVSRNIPNEEYKYEYFTCPEVLLK